jgi:DedD protein
MDRRVKERLVGATILVVLIVLIVPELLSGPKRSAPPPLTAGLPAPTRNVSVDLATSKAMPAPQGEDAASAAGAQTPGPPNVASTNAAAPGSDGPSRAVAARPVPPETPPAVVPPLETSPSPPKSSVGAATDFASSQSHHAWAVQLGSFASRTNADKLARQLKARGSSVYVISNGAGPSLRYRVRIGPLPDRDAAERAVIKLKAAGHPATVVSPAS